MSDPMDVAYDHYYKYRDEVVARREKSYKEIEFLCGIHFVRKLKTFIKSFNDNELFELSVVDSPKLNERDKQESEFPCRKYEWVQQWCTNMDGDTFDGIVHIHLKENKYLRFTYSS
jgi:hypothetical protein